jgi:hypothetical protein
MEARLQTDTLSRSCGSVISVHRLDRWIVPVLLFRARVLMVSFHVSHGWDVDCSAVRIALYCSRAPIRLWRSVPASASAAYSW